MGEDRKVTLVVTSCEPLEQVVPPRHGMQRIGHGG